MPQDPAFIHRRLGRTGRTRLGLVMAGIFVLVSPFSVPPAEAAEPKRIVTLYWYGKDFWSNVLFEQAMQDRLRALPAGSVEYYAEYLEDSRFPGEAQARLLRDYLVRKYADRRIDVVVAVAPAALNFLLTYRAGLFPGTPIVFHTVTRPEFSDRAPPRNLTGVISDNVYQKTLDLALQLHPETEHVLVIASNPEGDKRNERLFKQGLGGVKNRVAFTYLSDLPIDRLLAAVKEARERSLILYLWHSQAGPATTLEPADVLSLIERSASVPIYGPSRSYVGRGSVGGYIFDTSAAATRATEIALQVANGTRADDVAIAEVGSTPMFDSRQLRRWGVRESALPPGSLVLFRPPSFLDEYGRYVAGAVLVFAVETGLIVSLLFQRARRRRAEGAWRVSEARYRAVSETQTELVCRYLPDGRLTFVNDAYCRFWRKTRGQLIGTTFLERIPESRREEVRRGIESQLERQGAVSHEHEILLPDGSVGWQQWVSHAILDARGHVVELQAVGCDITERKHAEQALRAIGDALRESDERIEDLAGRLIAAQEAERKRIARDLHDDLSQKLALLSIDIEQLPRRTQAELSDYVRKISERAAEVATDVHHLAYQLHPSKLETLGLVAAIQGFCRDISRQHDLQVDFEHRHVPQDVPPEIALCLYRIVQEGVHNVVKHSGARQARVELVASDGVLDLHIADPGLGFATSMPGRASIGIGLVGMRERVNIVGGKIAIHTAPGAGTRIGVRVRIDGMRSQTRLTA